MGVIYAPASGALYAGGDGLAWRSVCDLETAAEIGPRETIRVADAPGPFRLVGSATYGGPKFKSFAASVGASATTQASSSMKFCQGRGRRSRHLPPLRRLV